MKLFLQTAMVFFGTLIAAGLVALGEPVATDLDAVQATSAPTTVAKLLGF